MKNKLRKFKLIGTTRHGKNRIKELGDTVTEKYAKISDSADILVEHEFGSLRWINTSGNDQNFIDNEIYYII